MQLTCYLTTIEANIQTVLRRLARWPPLINTLTTSSSYSNTVPHHFCFSCTLIVFHSQVIVDPDIRSWPMQGVLTEHHKIYSKLFLNQFKLFAISRIFPKWPLFLRKLKEKISKNFIKQEFKRIQIFLKNNYNDLFFENYRWIILALKIFISEKSSHVKKSFDITLEGNV